MTNPPEWFTRRQELERGIVALSTPSERLKWARISADFADPKDAFKKFKWKESTYYAHENGGRVLRETHAKAYAAAYKVNHVWLMHGVGTPRGETVPLMSLVGAGHRVTQLDESDGPLDYVDMPPLISEGLEAARVRGNSMYPQYRDGDIVYFEAAYVDPERCFGRECMVWCVSGEIYLKVLERGTVPGTFTLISVNAPPIPDVEIKRCAPVRWVNKA